tara:strand:- start:972 stop:1253 length:282 start_codon:yes stop_codon:yes gene_type:complete
MKKSAKRVAKRDVRKVKAIARKSKKITAMKKQLKTPSKTSGARGVKDYNKSSVKKRIARKTKAIVRKGNKLSEKARQKMLKSGMLGKLKKVKK